MGLSINKNQRKINFWTIKKFKSCESERASPYKVHWMVRVITSKEIMGPYFFKDDEAFAHKMEGICWMLFFTFNNKSN